MKNPLKKLFTKKKRISKIGNKEVHLNLVYTDAFGNNWYEPTDLADYPFIRINHIQTYSRYAELKMTPDRLNKINKAILQCASDGDMNGIIVLATEIQIAEQMFCEKTTLLRLASAMFLINNEPPNSWNEEYEQKKIESMLNDADCMAFFLPTAYRNLKSYSENSDLQVIEYLQESLNKMNRLSYLLENILQK
jgi:hypothetical protein